MRAAAVASAGVPRTKPRPRRSLAMPRPFRRRGFVVAALIALAISVLYVAWFRDSSFASVDRVSFSGLATRDAGRLRGELTAAAQKMTTLDVDEGALRAAVAREPLVRSVSAEGDFPHTLRIAVVLNLPVARLQSHGRSVAISGDGTLLPGLQVGSLPTLSVGSLPRTARVKDARTLSLVAIPAAAPAPLLAHIAAVGFVGGKGIVARLANGPEIVFGDTSRLAAKWAAAAAVLAQSSSAGAAYIDVREPQQPIAGGLNLPDTPLGTAAPDGSNPAAPGVIAATPSGGAGQATPATGVPSAGPAATPATPSAAPAATPATPSAPVTTGVPSSTNPRP